jgi:predicted metal-dependent hydrolase
MELQVLITLIIIFIYIFLFYNKKNMVYIIGSDGNSYLVYDDDKKQEKVERIVEIIKRINKLIDYLNENKNKYDEFKLYIDRLNNNFDIKKTFIYETDPNSNLTSYSINKGEEISICVKSKKTGEIHDINILMYVMIHEISHIACPETGHGELFKKIFKFLLEKSIELNIYIKESYIENSKEYCGMNIDSSILD